MTGHEVLLRKVNEGSLQQLGTERKRSVRVGEMKEGRGGGKRSVGEGRGRVDGEGMIIDPKKGYGADSRKDYYIH